MWNGSMVQCLWSSASLAIKLQDSSTGNPYHSSWSLFIFVVWLQFIWYIFDMVDFLNEFVRSLNKRFWQSRWAREWSRKDLTKSFSPWLPILTLKFFWATFCLSNGNSFWATSITLPKWKNSASLLHLFPFFCLLFPSATKRRATWEKTENQVLEPKNPTQNKGKSKQVTSQVTKWNVWRPITYHEAFTKVREKWRSLKEQYLYYKKPETF